jgi:phage major head subunit gpT-like protein
MYIRTLPDHSQLLPLVKQANMIVVLERPKIMMAQKLSRWSTTYNVVDSTIDSLFASNTAAALQECSPANLVASRVITPAGTCEGYPIVTKTIEQAYDIVKDGEMVDHI